MKNRILIIGGVAGGASAAARLRRLDEKAEIIIFERGKYVSFANCGLPYYVGNVIKEEKKLLQASPQLFKRRFNIDVRTLNEVTSINRATKTVKVKNLADNSEYFEKYDYLILSPGAYPVKPDIPGINLPGIFTLRNIPDSNEIIKWIGKRDVKRSLVIGAGFIGIEMVENLVEHGLGVTLLELSEQVLPIFDPEIAIDMKKRMEERGVKIILGDSAELFKTAGDGLLVKLKSGKSVSSGIVIMGIGVRPDTELAVRAGISVGERGHIKVDEQMRTSDSSIFAVGDAVEVVDAITNRITAVPLAGPANRQGRIAADVICGRNSHFRGVQATAVVGAFGMTLAITGHSEKSLKRAGISNYKAIWAHPFDHSTYYPNAVRMNMKLIFAPDGKILGAQSSGEKGVEKRIDVISAFIQKNGTVFDLEEAELCYAPQYGSAKDAVNMLGFISGNLLRGDCPTLNCSELTEKVKNNSVLIDVREPNEFAQGTIPGAKNIPLSVIREKMNELPKEKEIIVFCQVGQRAYYAVRYLMENGFTAKNLSGGYTTWLKIEEAKIK